MDKDFLNVTRSVTDFIDLTFCLCQANFLRENNSLTFLPRKATIVYLRFQISGQLGWTEGALGLGHQRFTGSLLNQERAKLAVRKTSNSCFFSTPWKLKYLRMTKILNLLSSTATTIKRSGFKCIL